MSIRLCILLTLFCAAATTGLARAASPAVHLHAPQPLPGDTLLHRSRPSMRTERFYDSLRTKTNRRAVPRMLYRMLFAKPRLDTTRSGQAIDESDLLEPYADKTIGNIIIERLQPFDAGGNWAERAANKTHMLTADRVIRRDLLFRSGDRLDPQLIVRNKQLLRSRDYIADVDIRILPDADDTTCVNLFITTRDSWSISVDAAFNSDRRTMFGVSDANVLGSGNRLKLMTNFSRRDFSYGGNMVEYEIPNLLGTFYTADLTAGRDFYNSTLDVGLHKEFFRTTDYEVGLTYSNIKQKRYQIEQDTSRLVRERDLNAWAGYAHYLPSIRSSVYLTARYHYRRVPLRPPTPPGREAVTDPVYHDCDRLLLSAGLYREKFYSANMIHGFGTREYVATGYKIEVTSGYSWGEYADRMYLGMNYHHGTFCPAGYLMGGIALGSFIDPHDGAWHHSAVDVDFHWFSNLFILRRSRIRQFLGFNYTQGWNRDRGNHERIRFTDENGLQAFKEYAIGTNRVALNTETVFFTPYEPLGFRIALFGFADFGVIGNSANPFRNRFFTTLGFGVRIKNERLAFNTIQIRLGLAIGKNGLVDAEYFRLSNSTRMEQYRYRPTRAEIVAFE